jgi:hypothetical protein
MIEEMKEPPFTIDLLKNSSRFGAFQTEPEDILEDKCPESRRGEHELGFERALADWLIKHRSSWRKSREPETQ